jgi:hypothetical protein
MSVVLAVQDYCLQRAQGAKTARDKLFWLHSTGSAADSFCFLWGWRLLWWAGIHWPAAAAACQSFFYGLYKKLTELSANNFRLLFCWLLVASWSLLIY